MDFSVAAGSELVVLQKVSVSSFSKTHQMFLKNTSKIQKHVKLLYQPKIKTCFALFSPKSRYFTAKVNNTPTYTEQQTAVTLVDKILASDHLNNSFTDNI